VDKTYQIIGLAAFAAQTGRQVVAIACGTGFLRCGKIRESI